MQHKVFRVERMFGGRAAARPTGSAAQTKAPPAQGRAAPNAAAATVQSLKRELALLHDAIARNKRELAVLIGDGRERRMAHAAGKLGAAVEGMEKATEKILKSTEVIDDCAKSLAASLKDDYKRGLAQEIQEHVVNIYEACNFQDLSGQRIGHVIETLNDDRGPGGGHARAPQRRARRRAAPPNRPPGTGCSTVPGSTAIPATPASATSTNSLARSPVA